MLSDNNKKILISGASGFIGQNFVEEVKNRRWVAYCPTRFLKEKTNSDYVKWIEYGEVSRVFESNEISAVINLATNYGRGSKIGDVIEANILMPIRLLEAAIKYNCPLFVTTDTYFNKTGQLYGNMQEYVRSKKELMGWIEVMDKSHSKIRIVNARLEHVYGPHDGVEKFTGKLIAMLSAGERIDLTAGEQRRDFIYVTDVVAAYIAIIEKNNELDSGLNYLDIGTGHSVSLKEFVELASKVFKSKSALNFGALKYRHGEIMESKADTSVLNRLGWKVGNNLKEGLIRWRNVAIKPN